MKLKVKANDETGFWEIHDHCALICKLERETIAKLLVGAINVLPYMMKALRMWIENNQCGSDMTQIDVEWTKRILAIAEARMGKEHRNLIDDSAFLP